MLDDFHTKISLNASRLKPYEGFIFLCGGPTDIRSVLPVSIRDAILKELALDARASRRIRVAEHYKDWSNDSVYRDLVSFEKHLAALSAVIVLVLESPGSIAELGLFSVIDEFQKKLLVVVETNHYTEASFIKLGPIDFLEKAHQNLAECHRWNTVGPTGIKFDPNAARELQAELAQAVLVRANSISAERLLNTDLWLDCALLVCDLLNFFSALTLREIRDLLATLGCIQTESVLRQTLYLLEKVGLIAMEPKGDQRFYVSVDARQFVSFTSKDRTFDLARFRSDQLIRYQESDKKRFRAITEARRSYEQRS